MNYLIIDVIHHRIYSCDTKEEQQMFLNVIFSSKQDVPKDLCKLIYYNNNKIISIRYK
jgi:hypothetical protein